VGASVVGGGDVVGAADVVVGAGVVGGGDVVGAADVVVGAGVVGGVDVVGAADVVVGAGVVGGGVVVVSGACEVLLEDEGGGAVLVVGGGAAVLVHGPPAGPVNPALQVQSVTSSASASDVDPPGEFEFAGQLVHDSAPVHLFRASHGLCHKVCVRLCAR